MDLGLDLITRAPIVDGGGKHRRAVHDNARLDTTAPIRSQNLGTLAADGDGAIGCADPATHRPMLDPSVSPHIHGAMEVAAPCPQRRVVHAVLESPELAGAEFRASAN